MSVCVLHPNFGCLIWHCALVHQNASRVYASGPGPWEVSPASSRTLWIMTQSTESPASLDRPIGAIFECLIGSKRPVYTSQLQYSVKVATSSYTVQLKYVLVYPGSYM